VPRSRPKRVKEAKRRLEEELWAETRANAAYEHYRATGRMKNGRRLGAHSPPKPYTPPATPEGRINLSGARARGRVARARGGVPARERAACEASRPHGDAGAA
jgi:hypothetical protein